MTLPKLKYYHTALNSIEYQQFLTTREISVGGPVTIDIVTGRIQERASFLILTAGAARADLEYRARTGESGSVYVLRIPREHIQRRDLTEILPNYYQYARSLYLPHCGVERFEPGEEDLVAVAPPPVKVQVLASSLR